MYPVSITSQGQISLPVKLLRKFGFKKPSKAVAYETSEGILFKPIKDFLELSGTFKTTKKPLSNSELHDLFGTYMAFRKPRPKLHK